MPEKRKIATGKDVLLPILEHIGNVVGLHKGFLRTNMIFFEFAGKNGKITEKQRPSQNDF